MQQTATRPVRGVSDATLRIHSDGGVSVSARGDGRVGEGDRARSRDGTTCQTGSGVDRGDCAGCRCGRQCVGDGERTTDPTSDADTRTRIQRDYPGVGDGDDATDIGRYENARTRQDVCDSAATAPASTDGAGEIVDENATAYDQRTLRCGKVIRFRVVKGAVGDRNVGTWGDLGRHLAYHRNL